MKNLMIALALVVTLLCGFILLQKNHELEKARVQLAAADRQRDLAAAETAQKEKRSKYLQARLRESRAETLGKEVETQELRQQLARSEIRTNQHAAVSEMFRSQAMKEALKAEAKVAIAKTVKALFEAGLAQQLQLNDNQSDALKQLLTQKASIVWEQMLVPMTAGELDEAGMAEAGKGIKQALEENAAQMRALLGDDGYNSYQLFEKTQPERDRLKQFSAQALQSGSNLTAEQQGQLLSAMVDERANFKFQFDIANPLKLDFEHWYDNFTDQKLNAYNQDMEQLNDRIVQRAQALLTPEQTELLKSSLNRELFHSMVTMRTTKSMMSANAR
ncbi:hypothetical protein [Pedosphaera parvula]|uniref:Uncharacterized protein n=1 Tax=Pedosphaera parvula (strain Ellin514) TaxID=320771 RepID=B9XJ95_PEDPL|nr:hypothetical protein [Pedosphaera parvula]EEF60133.1 hypothetical protein Cflav_PD3192 [Pedosphaera parvula Ellin514]